MDDKEDKSELLLKCDIISLFMSRGIRSLSIGYLRWSINENV